MHEKIYQRIISETKRQGKLIVRKELDSEIKTNKDWLHRNKERVEA